MRTETSSCPELAGAVLAAGRGSRMGGALDWLPKVMMPVAGRPLLHYQLELFRTLGIRRVVVVIGHLGEQIVAYLETTHGLGLEVETVEQRELLGPGHALLALEPRIAGPFALFLGDIFLIPDGSPDELTAPVLAGVCDASVAVFEEPDPERLGRNFRVDVDEGDRVLRVVEKPRAEGPGLKGCGLYAFTPAIFEAVRATPPGPRGEIGITESLQTLIDLGLPVRAARMCRWDLNLTHFGDLELCGRALTRLAEEGWSPTRLPRTAAGAGPEVPR